MVAGTGTVDFAASRGSLATSTPEAPIYTTHRLTVIVIMALMIAAWVLAFARIEGERKLIVENAHRTQATLAVVVAATLTQVMERGVQVAASSSRLLDDQRSDAGAHLSALLATDRAMTRLAVFSATGGLVFASRQGEWASLPQGYLATLASASTRTGSVPLLGERKQDPASAWQWPFYYPVIGRNRAIGAVLVMLDMGYFLSLYRNIELGTGGYLQVLYEHRELARITDLGLEYAPEPVEVRLPVNGGGRPIDTFGDGRRYLVAEKRLDGYPLAVAVGAIEDELLSKHVRHRNAVFVALFLTSALVVAALLWIRSNQRRHLALLRSLYESESTNRALVDELRQERERADALAAQDDLTGLLNRRMFIDVAGHMLAQGHRARHQHALLFIDLDRFKQINDSLGHHVGDLLLKCIAFRLKSGLRASDVVARVGGDEFLVLIGGSQTPGDVSVIAAKLVETIGAPCEELAGNTVQVSASIGIAMFPGDGSEVESLIRNADAAMYVSKQSGRGKFTFFDASLNPGATRLFGLERRLRAGLDAGEFCLHFQPKIALGSFEVVGFEALIRWQHPDHGLIYPGDFIPAAERSGQIVDLGAWVVEAACAQLAEWKSRGLSPLRLAVNISGREFREPDLAARIGAALQRHGVSPDMLELEVTESSLVENMEAARATLDSIARAGVRVALDDFGNGYSSFGYLRELPIQTLKIDRSFVKDIRNDGKDLVIVNSIITLAHNLGLAVVAEGVELKDQLVYLKTAGCDLVQGYLFSRPLTAGAAEALIVNRYLRPT
jgi:diguanylate cyclase (GGDEF)-like protein